MNLVELLHKKLDEALEEKFAPIAEKHIEKCINEIVSDLTSSWNGDFGKDLKKQLGEVLKVNLEREKIETYNRRVNQIIATNLNNKVDQSIKESIEVTLNETLSTLEKTTWKLTEIMQKFVQMERLCEEGSCEITCLVEESNYGSTYIYFDKDSSKRTYDCQHQIWIDRNGSIWNYTNEKVKRLTPIIGSFDSFCFALYTQRAQIIIDNIETEYYRD